MDNSKSIYTGVDIESVARIKKMWLAKQLSLKKVFFQAEWDYAVTKGNPAQTLTGIWCAKEAVVKALYELEPLLPNQIEISYTQSGRPYVKAHHVSNQNHYELDISISHTAEYAVAHAVVIVIGSE
jgi:holo-[acyl-carrier protein] synthase